MHILLTGFEPFGGEAINPSAEVVARVAASGVSGITLSTLILPVEFTAAPERLSAGIARLKPDAVVMLGEAGGRAAVSVERIAVNLSDARIPDNAGARPQGLAVVEGGPDGRFATLPVADIVAAIRKAGIPAEISMSAGIYVCNHVFYAACHLAAARSGLRVGFIHVPYAPEQTVTRPGTPSMAIETTAEAIRVALGVIAAAE